MRWSMDDIFMHFHNSLESNKSQDATQLHKWLQFKEMTGRKGQSQNFLATNLLNQQK